MDHTLFDLEKLDDYYRMNYRVIDVDGSLVDEGRDLNSLKQHYADCVQESVHADNAPQRSKLEHHNISSWDFGELHESVEYQHQGMTVKAYPSLVQQQDDSLSVLICDRQNMAQYQSQHGILTLALMTLSQGAQRQGAKYLKKELMSAKANKKSNKSNSLNSLAAQLKTVNVKPKQRGEWVDEIMLAGIKQACFEDIKGKPNTALNTIRNAQSFETALESGAKNWVSHCIEIEQSLSNALDHRDQVFRLIESTPVASIETDEALEDMKAQLYRLFEPHILRYTSLSQLNQYTRYLRAIESRIDKLKYISKTADQERALVKMQNQFIEKVSALSDKNISTSPDYVFLSYPLLREFAILLEEWRVSLFAQHLKTMLPVSEKRVTNAWQVIEDEL